MSKKRKKKAPFIPTSADLDQLTTSFWYEAGVLVSQGKLYLEDGNALAGDKARLYPVADALLDALLVRLRSLVKRPGIGDCSNP